MPDKSEIEPNEVFSKFNLEFDSKLITNQMQEEIELLVRLNKINAKYPVSSRIYLSLLTTRLHGIPSFKIGCYALLGQILGYRI
ncbi:MAG: hypothetical protein MUF45_08890 [Spirosomaceae bacterium]|jgi:hypothetical protein|nr:hypothetical protein [Spirosomataceae bacterium]